MNKEKKLELIEGILNDEISSFDYRDIEIEIDDNFFEEEIDAENLIDNGIRFVEYFYENRDKINRYIINYIEQMDIEIENKEDLSKLIGLPRIRMIDETIFTFEFYRSTFNMIITLEVNITPDHDLELSYVTIDD